MQPHQLSSGDVIADRRADYARMLEEGGEPEAAAELMEQALELVPAWAAGWYRLATYLEKAGRGEAAIDAYRRTLALGPDDIFGAALKLALLGDGAVPDRPPSRYVERLFDDYADRFESALVEKLDYSVPQKLAALIASTGRRYELAVDLGCGTGLLGPEIRANVDRLEGFDLSQNMLAKAAEKHVYDSLAQADLSLAPDLSVVFADAARHRADLVTAADVLMYLGNLESVFAIVGELAASGADIAFSVEDAGEGDGFHLAPSLRYAHSESYVRMLLARHGFQILKTVKSVIRKDGGKPVSGILFLTQKPA
ncbi:class I SAM-dependent DNA methyltransferase [Rhizobium leguminosarum]|jgi:predicted TPR repeat methyltransferase|uniref:class I SAM-dependent DNA methyltransferase n=1 Tax=Rhizobium leguminosarum TaxID=384 RepID=UPI0004756C82|nr:methyltransferase domain-containing protein [Rhizobium leguminosarum]MBY2914646.1 methyltransferase domain-containing protein [Rhizobium leguminosarum]MBY2926262.1 methyltransferase domain-containing protein [Rhizobium leguminosarum]MBY2935075.1 methyltransferase domain-containing protein [Rhizobium leguminosarum]MBY2964264.1 methyltransferase domain-containing protein [Rhizobium leguminosarum]MBY2970185.1 methyltransferase domain-containing protein [Rhizobium leguminosarum]